MSSLLDWIPCSRLAWCLAGSSVSSKNSRTTTHARCHKYAPRVLYTHADGRFSVVRRVDFGSSVCWRAQIQSGICNVFFSLILLTLEAVGVFVHFYNLESSIFFKPNSSIRFVVRSSFVFVNSSRYWLQYITWFISANNSGCLKKKWRPNYT